VTVRSPRQTECGEGGFTNVARRRTLSLINAACAQVQARSARLRFHFCLLFWRTPAWPPCCFGGLLHGLLGILPSASLMTDGNTLLASCSSPYSSHPGRRKNPGLTRATRGRCPFLNFVREHQPARQAVGTQKGSARFQRDSPCRNDMSPACVALKTYRGRSG
jgi:hypothetical protein